MTDSQSAPSRHKSFTVLSHLNLTIFNVLFSPPSFPNIEHYDMCFVLIGMASPFILLTLREPLEGMEGALLRSLLDIICLKTLANEQTNLSCSKDRLNGLGDVLSPVLSMDDSIELIIRTGLDSFLLSMLGVKNMDSEPEEAANPEALEKESVLDTEIASEPDTGASSLKPKEDQEEQEVEHPSDVSAC